MRKLSCTFMILLILGSLNSFAQSKKKRIMAGYTIDNYEVECMGTGAAGAQMIKIWGYGKKPDNAVIQAKMNAVHAIIFKGVYAGKPGCTNRPLVKDPSVEEQYQEYFNEFFQPGGKYLSYVAKTGEEVKERVKVNKKTYKVAIAVTVMRDALQQQLERDGIIKGLTEGF